MSVRYEIEHTIREVVMTWARVSGPMLDGPCDHGGMALLTAKGDVVACCEACGSRWQRPPEQASKFNVAGEQITMRWIDSSDWCGTFKGKAA